MDRAEYYAWHFIPNDRVFEGKTVQLGHIHETKHPDPIQNGIYASSRILRALKYATGTICTRVRFSGLIQTKRDRIAARTRVAITMGDVQKVLQSFACWCAEHALSHERIRDVRPWQAIMAKRRWMKGDATIEELARAQAAAENAADEIGTPAARSAYWATLGDGIIRPTPHCAPAAWTAAVASINAMDEEDREADKEKKDAYLDAQVRLVLGVRKSRRQANFPEAPKDQSPQED